MSGTPQLATREDVKGALDAAETARNNGQVDRALGAATLSAEGLLRRRFYPELATRYFDWPNYQYSASYRLWLGKHELISVASMTAGGVTIATGDRFLRPDDGPPYTHVEINLAGSASYGGGSTHQRAIAIVGLYGYRNDEAPAGTLAEDLDDSETAVDVSDSAAIGVGSLIRVDSERMIVTGKRLLTTGQTVQTAALTASVANVAVLVTDGTAFAVDEVVLVDAERMRIVDIAGNTLVVKRNWDGTVLAAHSVGATIYAPRTLVVTRGALGTTAAVHSTAAAISRHEPPALANALGVAEAMNTLLNEGSGYARVAGSGDNAREYWGRSLEGLRRQAVDALGRQSRMAAV